MTSQTTSRRRRRESESEIDEVEGDYLAQSPNQPSSSAASPKRARTGEHTYTSSPDSQEDVLPGRFRRQPHKRQNGSDINRSVGDFEHQAGAIVRVSVTDFVTYENASFYPGPNLNMVIGPNGTGKSSLVCAICLGLGYSPNHLGRASKIGEFVKHGKDHATIEIELKRRPDEDENPVVKVQITRDGDKRKWWLNGRDTSWKAVQALVRGFGIQVDNLCQFLPQDRVSEFAGLSPIDLLHETQRAAAPEEMLAWHNRLKDLRKEQKAVILQHDTDQDNLSNMKVRQDNLRGEVERLQERASIQKKIELLEKSVPFVEYRTARKKFMEHKQRKLDAQNRLKELERKVEPALEAVNAKQRYQRQVDSAVKECTKELEACEHMTDLAASKIKNMDEAISQNERERKAELDSEKKRKQDFQIIQRKIGELQARLQNAPPVFDSGEWNARIRAKEHRVRDIENELRDLSGREGQMRYQGTTTRKKINDVEQELAALDSQAGVQTGKLRRHFPETAKAWEWVQKNQDMFEKPVYGPPIIECSIKDPRYVDAIEALFNKGAFQALTVQSRKDYLKLQDHLYNTMGLADININVMGGGIPPSPVSRQSLEQFGLDGYAVDFIDGPETVVAMLCGALRLHATGIALQDISQAQFDAAVQSPVSIWVSGRTCYKNTSRKEYGAGATSTTTNTIRNARYWTDLPVDSAAKSELQEKIHGLEIEFATLKDGILPLREQISVLKTERSEVQKALETLKTDKNELQKTAGQFAALPAKIEREQESLEQKRQLGREFAQQLHNFAIKDDSLVLKKTDLALQHRDKIAKFRDSHEALLEAEIRLIEATSDVEALKARNQGIIEQLENERQLVTQVERQSKIAKDTAAKSLEVCKSILAREDDNEYFKTLDENKTIEDLEQEIDVEKAKLDYIHDGNAGALEEFETREVTIAKLTTRVEDTARKLSKLTRKITEIREKWEPELDKLIKEISDAFAYNFEQIGCAGEVGVHKDDDFDLWAIEIKVKFREKETLQILNQHRQSGGERSVSTIFYLMALQSLARAPFRVVDEINQGMDPRNERMVHERMVEIACKEHTSQYFLITPKLLPGLNYDPRMRVLCIASGEYMPEDHDVVDLRKMIEARRAINIAAAG